MMPFVSILGETPYHLKPSEIIYPSYFKDLNLDQIVKNMIEKWEDYDIERYFYYPAQTEQTLSFRREVFLALSDHSLFSAIMDFSMAMKKSRKFMEYRQELSRLAASGKTEAEIKCCHLLFDSANSYLFAVTGLCSALETYSGACSGFLSLSAFLTNYCASEEFASLCHDVQTMEQELSHLTFCMELSGTKLILHDDYETFDARNDMIQRCGIAMQPSVFAEMKSPFTNILELEELESLLLSMLRKGHRDIFRDLKDFSEKHSAFYEPLLLQFEQEIQVYLAAREFITSMQEQGFPFAFPKSAPLNPSDTISKKTARFLLNGSYDLALACKYRFKPEHVVRNDCSLSSEEYFFVVTGPNQGGKTTFARAVGQAVYFHQMGFPVAGTNAVLPMFSVLLTHFLVEENVKTGAGKLKEELTRLEPMIHSEKNNGFVILNELFTTATSYDAELMGKQVLRSFMKKGFCGIYVTHIQELAQDKAISDTPEQAQKGIVSMTALVDKDEKTRTYHMVRARARGLAYAQTIAEKYRLSYEDILNRIGSANQI